MLLRCFSNDKAHDQLWSKVDVVRKLRISLGGSVNVLMGDSWGAKECSIVNKFGRRAA